MIKLAVRQIQQAVESIDGPLSVSCFWIRTNAHLYLCSYSIIVWEVCNEWVIERVHILRQAGPSLLPLKRNVLPALVQNNENSSDCKFELKWVELTGSDSHCLDSPKSRTIYSCRVMSTSAVSAELIFTDSFWRLNFIRFNCRQCHIHWIAVFDDSCAAKQSSTLWYSDSDH